ncbi:peptidase S8/S53 domain-containing protein [Zychaea mexicana]|uniref:peptidase S8/S53 domain-containing protein n=1 Tax=Zychaea mexicana TaxID=64656 RepID=UPI0022FE238D|nr:peptidase S8/S53 domain-containing protein [Zychaea mexicana]KAI9499345.1 peptidase S8/S53 domain-containing protein [Zychaea mexicana]
MYSNTILLLPLLLLAILLIGLSDSTSALSIKTKQGDHQHRKPLPGRYLIEFAGDDDADKNSVILLNSLKTKFPEARLATPRVLNYELMRAATLQIDAAKGHLHESILKAVSDSNLVSDVYPLHAMSRPKGVTSAPLSLHKSLPPSQKHAQHEKVIDAHLLMAHSMTQVDRVHEEYNNTGEGIFIAIIDDGVDYMHPALGGGFGPGYKIRYGKDMIGVPAIVTDNEGNSNRVPDDDPMDNCGDYGLAGGHGTHVAGIIGAKSENYTGVAPDAILGMWRALDCTGYGDEDSVIESMLDAHKAGAHIISMSLGAHESWSEFVTAVVAERITANGTIVIAAAGNDGLDGAFTIKSPSVGKGVVSVASFDNEHTLRETIHVYGVEDPLDIITVNDTIGAISDGQVVAGDVRVGGESDACDAGDVPPNVNGKLAIVQRGNCTFDLKVHNLHQAGAIGVLIFFNESTLGDALFVPGAASAQIPVAGLSYNNGVTVLKAIERNDGEPIQLNRSARIIKVPTGNTVSIFSSVGPSYENDFKPNIAGVGGYVYSTFPRYLGSWKVDSGTSMATPYVSGAFALYLKAISDNKQEQQSPTYILEQFQNYAYKALASNETDEADSPYRQAAGLIQVYDAISQKTHVSPGSISFNDTANLQKTHKLTVTNNGDSIVSYEIVNKVSVSIAPYNDSSNIFSEPATMISGSSARLRFSRKMVKISPGATTNITLTVMPPDTDPKLHIMYGGYVELKSKVSYHKDITVPYIGIVGNQRDLPVFSDDSPAILDFNLTTIYNETNTFVFKLKDNSTQPVVAISMLSPSKLVLFRLYNEKKEYLGYAMPPATNCVRSTNKSPLSVAESWEGFYYTALPPADDGYEVKTNTDAGASKKQVGPGRYRIGVEALKLLGDPQNPHDWEHWTSDAIQVV